MAKQRYTREQVAEALRDKRGLLTFAAETLGCDYRTVSRYIERYPDLQDVIDHFRQRRADVAEYKLDDALERGEQWAISFTLGRIGKSRGYTEKQEIEQNINASIELATIDYRKGMDAIAPKDGE